MGSAFQGSQISMYVSVYVYICSDMYTYIRVYEHIICFASTYVPYIDHIHYGSKLGVHRCRDYVDPIYPY